MHHYQLWQENKGIIYLKSSFEGEFNTVDLNRIKISRRLEERKPMFSSVPKSQQKFNDLISLLPYVPSVCH